MIRLDEDALICDFAETYRILNFRGLPLHLVATLAYGLPNDCRIKKKLTNRHLDLNDALLAVVVDKLSQILWTKTEDAKHGRNKPKSLYDALEHPPERRNQSFSSVEAFERKREQLMRL